MRYGVVWAEIPREQYRACSAQLQRRIDVAIEELAEQPTRSGGSYDSATDLWTRPIDETTLLAYAVVHEHAKVLILRLVVTG